jgi:hypothetical protein
VILLPWLRLAGVRGSCPDLATTRPELSRRSVLGCATRSTSPASRLSSWGRSTRSCSQPKRRSGYGPNDRPTQWPTPGAHEGTGKTWRREGGPSFRFWAELGSEPTTFDYESDASRTPGPRRPPQRDGESRRPFRSGRLGGMRGMPTAPAEPDGLGWALEFRCDRFAVYRYQSDAAGTSPERVGGVRIVPPLRLLLGGAR